jgi:hypothetical protein
VQSLARPVVLVFLLLTSNATTWSADGRILNSMKVDGVSVNVEAMIGEATLVEKSADGKKATIVVPTGKATKKDPETGQIMLTPATETNKVNEVVRAIAATASDASYGLPTDEGCSEGRDPLRIVAKPDFDEAASAAITKQLGELTSGELMMVIAVLINNARHLSIDADAISNTISTIAKVRPEEAGNVVFVASLLDPDNGTRYSDAALKVAPDKADEIEQAKQDAKALNEDFDALVPPRPSGGNPAQKPPAKPTPPVKPVRDVPPGGSVGAPPSPE